MRDGSSCRAWAIGASRASHRAAAICGRAMASVKSLPPKTDCDLPGQRFCCRGARGTAHAPPSKVKIALDKQVCWVLHLGRPFRADVRTLAESHLQGRATRTRMGQLFVIVIVLEFDAVSMTRAFVLAFGGWGACSDCCSCEAVRRDMRVRKGALRVQARPRWGCGERRTEEKAESEV